jgi:putative aminopeptidase FrvX
MNPMHQQWLVELTTLPTAAGRESRVIQWVRHWAKSRRNVQLKADRYGNLELRLKGKASTKPLYFEAHMDHPAFVVAKVLSETELLADFRGGVETAFFAGSKVLLHHADRAPVRGTVMSLESGKATDPAVIYDGVQIARIEMDQNVTAESGDVLTWDTGPSRVEGDRLFVPACDDLAGVAAAICAFDEYRQGVGRKKGSPDVRLLLTRSEEIGFIGAIAACQAGTIPKKSRVIVLENSRSFAESPIGAGPIVRVGDRSSTFDPQLTYQISQLAQKLAQADPGFVFQRKLMPGGTCEATAYQAFGYTATCLCLPLGNYHNMNHATGRIEAETISLHDFAGLVRLLVAIAESLDVPDANPPLKTKLREIFARRKAVLD